MFRFYLDNVLVPDALNWFEFTETIERDEILKALLPKYDIKLTFTGAGYVYLYSQYKANGFCKLVQLRVEQQCSPNSGYEIDLEGLIFISDCTFNLNKCTVDCSVMDNNYGAKIFNNKSIKALLSVGRSKNDVTITPCSYNSIRMFVPSTGAYLPDTRRAYSTKDAFRFLIDFMTDGEVGFESNFLSAFDLGVNIEGTRIITGTEIRLHDLSTAPFISFNDLFHEVDIKYPLGFTIINVAGKPTIKIENEAYFKNESASITISNINDLKQSFNSEILYSKIKFGSTYLDYDGLVCHYPQIRFFNFVDEEYHFQGQCNIDKTLDLTGFIISDTNIIESCVATETDNDTYDNEIFFIQVDSSNSFDSIRYDDPITNGLPHYYNGMLQNNKVAERYNLQGDIATYLGNNDDLFRAQKTSQQNITSGFSSPVLSSAYSFSDTIAFQNDSTPPNFDTNGNYNNATYRFTSPANGNYNFESALKITLATSFTEPTGTILFQVAYSVYDSGGSLQRTEIAVQTNYVNTPVFQVGTFMVSGSKNIYIPSGWYIVARLSAISMDVDHQIGAIFADSTSYFLCNQSVNGGGVYGAEEPGDYFISKFEFDAPISKSDYDLMKSDLSKSIVINHDGQTNRTTWIRKSVRKLATGETTWEQISSKNNSQ